MINNDGVFAGPAATGDASGDNVVAIEGAIGGASEDAIDWSGQTDPAVPVSLDGSGGDDTDRRGRQRHDARRCRR